MRTLHLIVLSAALALTATSAFARGGMQLPGEEKRFCQAHLQANTDRLRANFETLDADHNGVLSLKESGLKHASRTCFYRLDRDHDHTLSPDELVRS